MKLQIGQRTLLAKTCMRCGELKQASEFKLGRRGTSRKMYYNSECWPCHKARIQKVTKDANNKSLDVATSHYYEWTDSDLTEVAFLSQMGHSAAEIAAKLNRTVSAIYNARQRLAKE